MYIYVFLEEVSHTILSITLCQCVLHPTQVTSHVNMLVKLLIVYKYSKMCPTINKAFAVNDILLAIYVSHSFAKRLFDILAEAYRLPIQSLGSNFSSAASVTNRIS